MKALTDGQVASIAFGAMVQAASDYHEWREAKARGWRTKGRKATKNKDAVQPKEMEPPQRALLEKWGMDAQAWFWGESHGGIDFKACCDVLGFDWQWLGNRMMTTGFWRRLNEAKDKPMREAFEKAAKEADDEQEAA